MSFRAMSWLIVALLSVAVLPASATQYRCTGLYTDIQGSAAQATRVQGNISISLWPAPAPNSDQYRVLVMLDDVPVASGTFFTGASPPFFRSKPIFEDREGQYSLDGVWDADQKTFVVTGRSMLFNGRCWQWQAGIAPEARAVGPKPLKPDYAALAGAWTMGGPWNKGGACRIEQNGAELVFHGEIGNRSVGKFIDHDTIVASEWEGGLRGHVSKDGSRIDWGNGSWWLRSTEQVAATDYPNLAGRWYMLGPWNKGGECRIEQRGGDLVFHGEIYNQSVGKFLDSETVVATDWEGGLRGSLSLSGTVIHWANGSSWGRKPPPK